MQFPLYGKNDPAERASRRTPLTFPAILSDPLVRLLMKADRVDPEALERCLSAIAETLPPQPEPAASACC